ncbi:copper-binding protein [Chitinimonas sp. BJYL2]|uniref:copper-binding protein n=1 Tax=Chitinimonas sp. BJYL2 TaxID=2976696 RepID=UPI0022B2B09D|nr:copper-binding protein [Chitinimonas sp. BJYL2]
MFKPVLMSALLIVSSPAFAAADDAATASATTAQALAEGEVRKIDLAQQKITLKHSDLPNLGMPPMTMVFKVKDPALLTQVKVGDKVRFHAEKLPEGYTVMSIQVAQ